MARPRRDKTPPLEPNKHKLNDLFVKNLKPQDRVFLVWDTRQRGLALQVQPTGHRAWKCIYHFHGRPRWYHIGDEAAIGLADARKLASRVMFQVAEGKDPQAERRAERSAGTFQELATRYCEVVRTTGKSRGKSKERKINKSWRQADALVRKHLVPRWGKMRPAEIKRSDVERVINGIEAPITANQVLAAASAIYSWAIKQEIVTGNPCSWWTERHNRAFARPVRRRDSEVLGSVRYVGLMRGTALKVLLLTGQRPGEVCHMRREHVEAGWWTMPGKPFRSRAGRGRRTGRSHGVVACTRTGALVGDGRSGPRVRRPAGQGHRRARCGHAQHLFRAEGRAGDAARSPTDPRIADHWPRLRARRHEPGAKSQGGRDRGTSTIGLNTARKIRRSWKRWPRKIVALAEGGPGAGNVIQARFEGRNSAKR